MERNGQQQEKEKEKQQEREKEIKRINLSSTITNQQIISLQKVI